MLANSEFVFGLKESFLKAFYADASKILPFVQTIKQELWIVTQQYRIFCVMFYSRKQRKPVNKVHLSTKTTFLRPQMGLLLTTCIFSHGRVNFKLVPVISPKVKFGLFIYKKIYWAKINMHKQSLKYKEFNQLEKKLLFLSYHMAKKNS